MSLTRKKLNKIPLFGENKGKLFFTRSGVFWINIEYWIYKVQFLNTYNAYEKIYNLLSVQQKYCQMFNKILDKCPMI